MVKVKLAPQPVVVPQVVSAPDAGPRHRKPGSRRYARLNTNTGRLLALVVILSAIPISSVRPPWWLIWAVVVGLAGALYSVRASFLMPARRPQITRFRLFFGLAVLVPLYAVIQSLPLAQYLPLALQTL